MPGTQRRIDPGLSRQLLAAPHRFQFFQAVRLLERMLVGQGVAAEQAVAGHIRFHNNTGLGFPATELAASSDYCQDKVHLTPHFMGLLGGNGALPWHYTESLQEQELYQRDDAARGFLDIFSNRALALHYAAWKKHRLALQYELDRQGNFVPQLLALAGLGSPGLQQRMEQGEGALFDQAVAYYAGVIRQRPLSAAVQQRVLSDYFQLPVRLEQFVGSSYRLPAQQCNRLGQANVILGQNLLAGDRVWQRNLRLRLVIGPLPGDKFDQFLPGGSAAKALAKWLRLLCDGSLEHEVRLLLRAEDVRCAGLGRGTRLGWDGYLLTRQPTRSCADCHYLL